MNANRNVAVAFYGNFRTGNQCADSLMKALNEISQTFLNVDFFGYFGEGDASMHRKDVDKDTSSIGPKEIADLYNAVMICIVKQEKIDLGTVPGPFGDINIGGFYNMFKSMANAFALVEEHQDRTNMKYDLVVMMRTDEFFLADAHPSLASILMDNTPEKLGVSAWNYPEMYDLHTRPLEEGDMPQIRGCDLIYMASPEIIAELLHNWEDVVKLLKDAKAFGKLEYPPEAVMVKYALGKNIRITFNGLEIGKQFGLLRDPLKTGEQNIFFGENGLVPFTG